ncbi:ATP-dependent RNA helicase RhlE [Candidatus Planktophila dulcis]|uniref:DEAD/DEAH box helicase n=1 Tax=Candidatus Planktophila dulcis TaxID=1884914 RepID=UPI000BAC7FAB|nr:DEAD/DEAH box helicase [Candidatus Planktophila dulcis]ASY14073.1 ATP-dependent RNA helicase RhlE [Candidatus Planktophila dulcis]
MSLQTRTAAPGKARRAAKGKPRHTTAEKAARKAVVAKPAARGTAKRSAPVKEAASTAARTTAKTTRYSDRETGTKKEVRLADRSKLRAQRFQERTASKSKNVEGAVKGNPKQSREERTFEKPKRAFKPAGAKPVVGRTAPERTAKPQSRAAKFIADRTERSERPFRPERPAKSDVRPTTRREAVKAKVAHSDDGRPNFVPQKREKYNPAAPQSAAQRRGDSPRTPAKPPRDRRNDSRNESPAYARDDFRASKTHNKAAVDFGADDNYISVNLADANLVEATPLTEVTTSFRDLGIAPALANALNAQGITHPFPIQIATLPDALAGHDILGRGQTGSGKTLAFSLALLTNISDKTARPHKPLALILTPTRELAQQIDEVLRPLARAVGHESVVIAGGMPYAKQITAMRKATAILVATPGRLIDLLNKNEVQLDQLQITVLDEADQMADMGFLPVVKEILDQARLDGQRLLFSATLDRGVDSLVRQYLKNPKTHSLQNDRASVSTMEHHVLQMHPGDKDDITSQIAARNGKTILFVKTQRGADRLADKLANAGVPVGALHGGKSQAVRTRTLALFKEQDNSALVATDVAARGIHVDGISLVVHVDLPQDHKDYLHRSGRTARAGESGTVVTLSSSKNQRAVSGLLGRAGVTPKFHDVRPLDEKLMVITGAQEPSGVPYIPPVMERKSPGGSRSGGGARRGGSGSGKSGGYRGGNSRRGR